MNMVANSERSDNFHRVRGVGYCDVLGAMHRNLKPDTYLEIGTFTGATLKLSEAETIAVDPMFRIQGEFIGSRTAVHLYQLTSDQFFKRYSPSAIFGRPVEIAFLDGMHRFEYLLRDFINTEKHCRRNSIIALHDCLPGDAFIACRDMNDPGRELSRFPAFWAGDVWKIVPILNRYRPDLKLVIADAAPTGLVFATNLDPASETLSHRYYEIVGEWMDVALGEYGPMRIFDEVDIVQARDLVFPDGCAKYFWL